jgi:hypothetical protein
VRLVAFTMVKDEADVIERTLWNVAAQGADDILVLDNESSDDTRGILASLGETIGGARLKVWTDWQVGYYQSAKMTDLARYAGEELDATWVWPFDADELWTWPAGRVRDVLTETRAFVVGADLFNHYATLLDPPGHPMDAMGWRSKTALGLPKVIARYERGIVIEPGNHAARIRRLQPEPEPVGLRVHHYPYRGADHFVRKAVNGARAYAATDLPPWIGEHWRSYGDLVERGGEPAARAFYEEHFTYDDPVAGDLVFDPQGVPDALPPAYDPRR